MNASSLSLRARVAHAGGWTLLSVFLAQALRLGSNIVLTRLLAPELFGVMGLALAFIFALTMFSDVGLQQNVIQHHSDDDDEFLNTIWTVQVIRGALIALVGSVIAGGLLVAQLKDLIEGGSAYAHPSLPLAVLIVSSTALISGFASTNLMTASRRLVVRPVMQVELLAQLAGAVVCIVWALISPTILAVTSGAVAAAVTKTTLSHFMVPGTRNRPGWAQTHFRSIHLLGRWVFLSSVLGFLASTADRLIFGGILSAQSFGIYAIAILVIGAPIEIASRLVASTVYPALSEAYRREPSSLSRIYYAFRLVMDPAAFFLTGVLVASSDLIVSIVFGASFSPMSEILPILAFSLVASGHVAAGYLFMLIDRPQIMTLLILVRAALLCTLGPILALKFGMVGAAWAFTIGQIAPVAASLFLKARYGFLRPGRELIGLPFLLLGFGVGSLINRVEGLL